MFTDRRSYYPAHVDGNGVVRSSRQAYRRSRHGVDARFWGFDVLYRANCGSLFTLVVRAIGIVAKNAAVGWACEPATGRVCQTGISLSLVVVTAVWVSFFLPFRHALAQDASEAETVVIFDEVDPSVRGYLEQAQQFFAARQWSDAVHVLNRVAETYGQKLIWWADPADEPVRRHVPVTQYIQLQLLRWMASTPEIEREYRELTAAVSQRLWNAARQGDMRAMEELLDYYFLTEHGALAALQYSELLLEQGRTIQARGWLERLHPAMRTPSGLAGVPSGRPLWLFVSPDGPLLEWIGAQSRPSETAVFLVHPQRPVGFEELLARAWAISRFEARTDRIRRERRLLSERFSTAQGMVAGRSGPWLERIASLPVPATNTGDSWTTFAGQPNRNGVWSLRVDPGGRPLWKVKLPKVAMRQDPLAAWSRAHVAEGPDDALAYFPVVHKGHIWLAQANGIRALDVRTGSPVFATARRVAAEPENSGLVYESPSHWLRRLSGNGGLLAIARYTLSASGSLVVARLGQPVAGGRGALDFDEEPVSWIVALNVEAEGRLLDGFPLEPPGTDWGFEGTPVVDSQRMYVALRRQTENRADSAVAAYDLSGRLLWMRSLVSAQNTGRSGWMDVPYNLLTLYQGTLYFNSNLGVIAALETSSGKIHWLVRYPRRLIQPQSINNAGWHLARGLTPALVYHDVVVVAPADSDRIFALDAFSGQLLWSLPSGVAADVVHLLGVKDEMLIASGDYLYWIDVRTGELCGRFPEPFSQLPETARPSPRGYGRGLIAGEHVLWPTREALYLFAVHPPDRSPWNMPLPLQQPRPWEWYGVQPGHLIPAGDVLLVVGADEMAALPW